MNEWWDDEHDLEWQLHKAQRDLEKLKVKYEDALADCKIEYTARFEMERELETLKNDYRIHDEYLTSELEACKANRDLNAEQLRDAMAEGKKAADERDQLHAENARQYVLLCDAQKRAKCMSVDTAGRLDDLLPGTVIRTAGGAFACKDPYQGGHAWYPAWLDGDAYSQDFGWQSNDIKLPATIYYAPEAS